MHHDQCRNTFHFPFSGQNLGYRANSKTFDGISDVIEKVINAWYDEKKLAAPSDLAQCCNSSLNKNGHFLQLVQDVSHFVGCAASKYTNNGWKTTLLACNYSFTNYLGRAVYRTGSPASDCGSRGRNYKFTALCNFIWRTLEFGEEKSLWIN